MSIPIINTLLLDYEKQKCYIVRTTLEMNKRSSKEINQTYAIQIESAVQVEKLLKMMTSNGQIGWDDKHVAKRVSL